MASRADGKSYADVVKAIPKIACKGDLLIQQFAEAMSPASSNPSHRILPVSGLFCPSCSHGAACAFHASSTLQGASCNDVLAWRGGKDSRQDWKCDPQEYKLKDCKELEIIVIACLEIRAIGNLTSNCQCERQELRRAETWSTWGDHDGGFCTMHIQFESSSILSNNTSMSYLHSWWRCITRPVTMLPSMHSSW